MKRILIIFGILLALSIVVVGCGKSSNDSSAQGGQTDQEKYNWKIATTFPDNHPIGAAMKRYAELVEERTEGNVKFQLFYAGALGGDREQGESLQRGDLEMAFNNFTVLSGFNKNLELPGFPYLVSNYDQADKVFFEDGFVTNYLKQELEKIGVVTLGWYENGFRAITNSKRPINSLNDVKGLKIRVPEVKSLTLLFEALGAIATPIPAPEIYTALQQKTVDGQDNGMLTSYSNKFSEVNPYLTLSNHTYASGAIVISKSLWAKLSLELQDILKSTAEEVSLWQREQSRAQEKEVRKLLEDQGMTVTDLSPEVMEEFVSIGRSIWPQLSDGLDKDAVDKMMVQVESLK